MWRPEDLEHPQRALRDLAPRLEALPPEWLGRWAAIDDAAEADRVLADLRRSAAAWARALGKAPPGATLCGVSFYFAGTEVAPYLPQDVWADGLAEVKRDGARLTRGARLFREAPAFDLGVAGELLTELGEDEALHDSAEGEALAQALVLRSLSWLDQAARAFRGDAAFAALPVADDFVFLVSPGHDEPWGLVGQDAPAP